MLNLDQAVAKRSFPLLPIALLAMVAISIMFLALGRDVTVQIWNPYAALMPFLLFLVRNDEEHAPLSHDRERAGHSLDCLPPVPGEEVGVAEDVEGDHAYRPAGGRGGLHRRLHQPASTNEEATCPTQRSILQRPPPQLPQLRFAMFARSTAGATLRSSR